MIKRKAISAIIICMLLTSCTGLSFGEHKAASQNTFASLGVQPSAILNEKTLYKDGKNLIAESRTAVSQLFMQEKISENAFTFLYNLLSGDNQYYNSVITDFKLVYNEAEYKKSKKMQLSFNVSIKEYSYMQNGSYDKDFYDSDTVMLVPHGQKSAELPESEYLKNNNAKLLSAFFEKTGGYEIAQGTDLKQTASEENETYNIPFDIESIQTIENGDEVICIQFYSDYARLASSHLVRYHIDKNSILTNCEIINYGYSPAGIDMAAFQKRQKLEHNIKLESMEQFEQKYPIYAALASGDVKKLTEVYPESYETGMEAAAKGFTVNSASSEIYTNSYEGSFVADLDVTSSTNPNFPIGKNEYFISYGMMAIAISPLNSPYIISSTPAEQALNGYLDCYVEGDIFLPLAQSNNYLSDYIVIRLMKIYPSRSSFTLEQMQAYAQEYLGISGYVPPDYYKQSNGEYFLPGRGGTSVFYNIEAVGGTREKPVYTVQYYSDYSKLVFSHKISYTLQLINGEYKIMQIDVLEKSAFDPLCSIS